MVEDGQRTPPRPGPPPRKRKQRPQYSCLNCFRRKIKCDRVKPCRACCMRGTPSECEYSTSQKDQVYRKQSAMIDSLQQTCDSLRQQLNDVRDTAATLISSSLVNQSPIILDGPYHPDGNDALIPEERARRLAALLGNSTSRSRAVPRALSQIKTFSGVFIQHFIDDFTLVSGTNNIGFVAFQKGAELRAFSPFLCSAFDAASLIFVARREGNQSIEACGQKKYVQVLKMLQDSLNCPERSILEETLVVVVLFTVIEAYKGSSKDAMLRHQLGALQLLQARTPYRHRYGVGRSLFVDLRLYWVSAALVMRKPTFLASHEWRTVPWPPDGPPKNILHHLLDIVVEIPAYLHEVDKLLSLLHADSVPSSVLVESQTALSNTVSELDGRLLCWQILFADQYPLGTWWEDTRPPNEHNDKRIPIFQCRDLTTMRVYTPSPLVYPDILLLTSMLYYWAARLILSQPDASLVKAIGVTERYTIACNICRSVKNYIETVPGGLLSRLMFILRVVYDTFPEGTIEKQFVSQVFGYITNVYRSTIFENKCSELAVKGK